MTAPITPDERAAMRETISTLDAAWEADDPTRPLVTEHATLALLAHVASAVPRLLDALDTAEAKVAPSREAVIRIVCDAVYGDPDNPSRATEAADAVLDLWPGESRAQVQAEALRAFARSIDVDEHALDRSDPGETAEVRAWMRSAAGSTAGAIKYDAENLADRLAAEGGDGR